MIKFIVSNIIIIVLLGRIRGTEIETKRAKFKK